MIAASPLVAEQPSAKVWIRRRAQTWKAGDDQNVWRFLRGQGPFLVVGVQFGLIVLLVLGFHLESQTFGRLMVLTFVGFLIHHYLPPRWRLPFFALLSLAATVRVAHMPVGLVLAAIGLGLIGICHLPIPFWGRTALLGAVGAGLTAARAKSDSFSELEGMWPILGSMFIFRLLSYLYDLKHRAAPFSPARALSYFFMIPNVCFPLFPVVDYKTFCTTYFNEESLRIYQSGLKWMLRGIVQLLLYRLIYHFALLDVAKITDARSVAEYVVATYLLYLHVSGQFHLIVGLLHMFGFNLPETHHRYLLASSFTDFWRRINIYWKDFIMKLFFYPAFFALRRIGTLRAMALATLWAFFATWALHTWQWFWFRGRILLTWQDVSFWSILALLVLVNALHEAVVGRRRTLSKPSFDVSARVWLGLKTVGTFAVICALWTLWSCRSWEELQVLADAAGNASWRDAAVILAGAAGLGVAGMLWGGSTRETSEGASVGTAKQDAGSFWRSAMVTSTCALGLLALVPASGLINAPGPTKLLATLRQDQLNAADADLQRRGYYEELDVVRANYRVWRRAIELPDGWIDRNLFRKRDGFLRRDMAPSVSGILCGTLATTNEWGMRDRDYDQQKPPGTYRIILLGSSHEVGSGVKDDETFENLVEDRLNERSRKAGDVRYEILNMSVGGYGVLRKLVHFEGDGLQFAPDAVIIAINAADPTFDLNDISTAVRRNWEMPYDYLDELFKRARVDRRLESLVIKRRLEREVPDMYRWAFTNFADMCAERGIRALALYRPGPIELADFERVRQTEVVRATRQAGLEVIDLSAAYNQVKDRNTLVLAPWDGHTNALGHRLLADKLYVELSQRLFDRPKLEEADRAELTRNPTAGQVEQRND